MIFAQKLDGFVPWPDAFAELYRRQGLWTGDPLDDIPRGGARRFPEHVAVVCGARRITYADLDARVDRVASALWERGLRPRDRVVVQLPNVLELVEALFALFRVGAIPVMALPGHRRAEIASFITQSDAVAYIIADEAFGFDYRPLARAMRDAEGSTLRHVFVVGDAQELTSYAELDAPPRSLPAVPASEVALLQLSGGSTGTPKLIARTHDDYLYSVRTSAPICGLTDRSVYLAALPGAHNFTLSSAGILGALIAGGTVVMCMHPSPDTAFPLLEKERVTITAVVPPLARVWLTALRARSASFPSLEVLQVGGAKLGPELARELAQGFGCRLQQVFGMAEGLVNYTRLDDPLELVTTTQGRPMSPADEVRVVDDEDRDVPTAQVGHLLTRGPYTIRGYFRAPEHNRVAFTADGYYRTGDRVRRTEGGYLIVEGRAKEQINKGGEKVAPVELEQHLMAHPSVDEAAVIALPDPMIGERICAVIVPSPDATLRRPDVLAHLRGLGIADYKLPDRVEFVRILPKTSVGKIDKNNIIEQLSSRSPEGKRPSESLPTRGVS
ncbi:MAG TPA: AMP-binding protein [Labilithrix sp.]|nr:AMP-binding protein [Labilithrix sp.]